MDVYEKLAGAAQEALSGNSDPDDMKKRKVRKAFDDFGNKEDLDKLAEIASEGGTKAKGAHHK